jgi:hypothetical protein
MICECVSRSYIYTAVAIFPYTKLILIQLHPASWHRYYFIQEWGAHWTADAETVLEKSPSSLLRTRFLQKLYPDAYFLCIMRHPVATAYATFSWGSQHGGADSLSPDSVVGFVDHWLVAHAIFEEDASHLKSLRRIHLEQLAAEPQTILDAICSDLGLHSYVVPAGKVTKNVNLKCESLPLSPNPQERPLHAVPPCLPPPTVPPLPPL